MPMTPQQLIDLPGYGAAEKQLRKEGRWELTAFYHLDNALDDLDQLEHFLDTARYAIRKAKEANE